MYLYKFHNYLVRPSDHETFLLSANKLKMLKMFAHDQCDQTAILFFHIWPLGTMKICLKYEILAKVGLKICQIINCNSRNA